MFPDATFSGSLNYYPLTTLSQTLPQSPSFYFSFSIFSFTPIYLRYPLYRFANSSNVSCPSPSLMIPSSSQHLFISLFYSLLPSAMRHFSHNSRYPSFHSFLDLLLSFTLFPAITARIHCKSIFSLDSSSTKQSPLDPPADVRRKLIVRFRASLRRNRANNRALKRYLPRSYS